MRKYYVPLMKTRKGRDVVVGHVVIYAESREMAYEIADKTYDDTNIYPSEPTTEEPNA